MHIPNSASSAWPRLSSPVWSELGQKEAGAARLNLKMAGVCKSEHHNNNTEWRSAAAQ